VSLDLQKLEILQDPDAADAPAARAPVALPRLDDLGEIVRVDKLPPDFPENAKAVGDGSYQLTLDFPVTLRFVAADGTEKTEVYKTLHLRRMTGATHRLVREAPTDAFRAHVLMVLAGLTLGRATLLEERMDPADMAAVLIVFRFFTTPGRRTGP
jgi:hypothetical protein